MTGRRSRLLALTVGVAGLVSLGGLANTAHAGTYRVGYAGPFDDQSVCDASSANRNEPPDVYSTPCFYSATGVPGYKLYPGWYYSYRYSID
jgi:hypothetical protein